MLTTLRLQRSFFLHACHDNYILNDTKFVILENRTLVTQHHEMDVNEKTPLVEPDVIEI